MKALLRPGRWLCQHTLRAAALRLGARIVVVRGGKEDGWEKPIAVGECRNLREPIVLSLRNDHYQVLRAKPGCSLPAEWTKAVSVCRISDTDVLRGAGSSERSVSDSWLPPVPEDHALDESVSEWLPAPPPPSASDWMPPRVSCQSETSCGGTSRQVSLSGLEGVRRRLVGKQRVHGTRDLAVMLDHLTWTCNLCGHTARAEKKNLLSHKRRHHLDRAHPKERSLANRIKHMEPLVIASVALPASERSWTCTACQAGLPSLNSYRFKRAVRHHLKACSGMTPRQNRVQSIQEKDRLKQMSLKARKVHAEAVLGRMNELVKLTGHDLCRSKDWTVKTKGFAFLCKKCCRHFEGLAHCSPGKPCKGRKGNWERRRWKLWHRMRLKSGDDLKTFVKECALSLAEVELLENSMSYRIGKTEVAKLPPLQSCQWWRDLCAEGVEPNPGPRSLGVISSNVSSFETHGVELLHRAAQMRVGLVCMQELNLAQEAIPGAGQAARQAGWHLTAVPRPAGTLRGGVGILCKDPWSCIVVKSFHSSDAQLLMVTAGAPGCEMLTVITGYRRPKSTFEIFGVLNDWLAEIPHKPWILTGDWNVDVSSSRFADVFLAWHGTLVSSGLHQKGSHAIDAIVASSALHPHCEAAENFKYGSDHDALLVGLWRSKMQPCLPEMRFARHRAKREPVGPFSELVSWSSVSVDHQHWQQLVRAGSINELWKCWNLAAERYLTLNQVLSDHQGEVCLGSSPQIRLGGSSKGVGQAIRERQARRVYRRACEAHFQATRGQVNPRLVQSLVRSFPVGVELIQQEDWPGLESLAKKDLTQVIQDKQKDLARRWKAQVSSLAGACAWVKKTSPPPPVLQQADGTLVFGKQSGVEALFQDWQPIFCGDPDETLAVDKYRRLYDPFILQSDGFSVPELDVADLRKAAQKAQKTAAGCDGWSAALLLVLPNQAWLQLVDILTRCETDAVWPDGMLAWRVVYLPKEVKSGATSTMKVRPIAIGPALYRLWSSVRAHQLGQALQSKFSSRHAGGTGGVNPQVLLLDMQVKQQCEGHDTGVSLDFEKAFDKSSWPVSIWILEQWGAPVSVLNALRAQWRSHYKFLSFDGAVHPCPVRNATGIPQGDPFSPLALACFLAAPFAKLCDQVPGSHYLYADDRTSLVHRQHVQGVLDSWLELESVSRMRGNAAKTQVWSLNDPNESGIVLGSVLCGGDAMHEKELERIEAVNKLASRISLLPSSIAVRADVAASMMSNKAVWNQLITGRMTHEPSAWRVLFRKACMGGQHGRASRNLELLARWGHRGDLSFLATQRVLATLCSWWERFGIEMMFPLPDLRILRKVNVEMRRWCWTPRQWGVWEHASGVRLDIRSQPAQFGKMLHHFRESWRSWQFNSWLQNRQRRDSAIGRELNLQYSEHIGSLLKGLVKRVSGEAAAVLVGGMSTPATVHAAVRPQHCPYCHEPVVPSIDHVLWVCRLFAALRVLPRPVSDFTARLGWGPGMTLDSCLDLLQQMGNIRHEEHTLRRRTLQAACTLPEDSA